MPEGARHLHIVDPQSGEVFDKCPECKERDRELARMRSIIVDLRRDKTAEARAHELWPLAMALWEEWKIATGRTRSKWRADRFWQCERFLADDGFVICRWAVWGIAFRPNEKEIQPGHVEVYNDWKLCFRDSDTFERYAKRGYMNPEARVQFSLREMGVGADDERIDPNLHFATKAQSNRRRRG